MFKLYRFEYSCYARKAQCVLDLMGVPYQVVDVPFGDRSELVELTGGYVQVPVLVTGDGRVIKDSRNICLALTATPEGAWLVSETLSGPVWAYADWCDAPLEDVMFRIATPQIRQTFPRAADRALFTFIKERKHTLTGKVNLSVSARRAQPLWARIVAGPGTNTAHAGGIDMLYWSLVFLVIAIVAAVLGFGGIAAGAAGIAKILFFVFLVIFLVSLVLGLSRRGGANPI